MIMSTDASMLDFLSENRSAIFYIHIPRCGGTTLTDVFKEIYGEEFTLVDGNPTWWSLIDANKAGKDNLSHYKAICGHYVYGLHERFHQKPRYLSVTRNPVDRCFSAINFIKSNKDHYLHPELVHLSPDDALYRLIQLSEFRLISGQCELISQHDNFLEAKNIINNNFFLSAPLERLEDLMTLLEVFIFKKKIRDRASKNISPKNTAEEFSSTSIDEIKRIAQEDFKLHEYVMQKFSFDWNYLLARVKS